MGRVKLTCGALTLIGAGLLYTAGAVRSIGSNNAEWVINDQYRLAISVDPGQAKRFQTPVSAEIDFAKIFEHLGIQGRLDRNSIRIVRFDPASGRALLYQPGISTFEVPYQLSRDFYYQDSGKI